MIIKIDEKLARSIKDSAAIILNSSSSILVVGQLDCDGVCASGIIKISLDRLQIKNELILTEKLDSKLIKKLKNYKSNFVIFCDFGLTKKEDISKNFKHSIIVDHHLHYSSKKFSFWP